VHQARLHPGLGVDGLDRLGEAGQPVDAAHEYVLDAAGLQIGQDLQPELGALCLLKPHAEHVAVALEVHPDRQITGEVAHCLPVADLDHERVQVEDRVDLLKRPGLPGLGVLEHRGGDAADRLAADPGPVQPDFRSS